MARKKETDYFEAFVGGVNSACAAADMLCTVFDHYEPEALPGHIEAMHKIEHSADIAKHGTMEQLVREFLPPIDREDIMELSGTIDDVTDSIEDVLLRLYMFNIRTLRPEAQAFAQVIADCCAALKTMMEEFPNFRRSKTIHTQIVEINGLEEQGDKLYTDAMHTLYADASTPVDVMAWTALFDRLEKCCDKCEDVADVVERVILKNSCGCSFMINGKGLCGFPPRRPLLLKTFHSFHLAFRRMHQYSPRLFSSRVREARYWPSRPSYFLPLMR